MIIYAISNYAHETRGYFMSREKAEELAKEYSKEIVDEVYDGTPVYEEWFVKEIEVEE